MREHVKSSEQLQEAFETFNEQSVRLQDSYQSLETLVASLSSELQATQNQRLIELAEKEQLAERLVTLLNALPAGVIVIDANGIIQDINPAAKAMFCDYQVGAIFDQTIAGISLDMLQESNDITLPCGSLVSCQTQKTDHSTILLFNDISERVALEKQISHQERLSSMGEMLAKLAHQLRTPLSSSLLYASNLTNSQIPESRRVDFAEKIQDSLNKQNTMINDMLVFSKNDNSGKDCLSVSKLLVDIKETLKPQLEEMHAKWLVEANDEECFISGSYSLLAGALSNLVMNALHASGKGATITWIIEHSDENLYLSIQDNGPGISNADAEKIFDPFFTTHHNGTGLGLAVARNVIQAHKGTIILDNASNKGARFLITLPYFKNTGLLASNEVTEYSKQKDTVGSQVCL